MAKPRMTVEQARATHPELTAWVGASAGTGKTHVLTARVLRLMLTGTDPENIVCLTFTKAAAAEMKNRIFEELGRWTLMADDVLAAEITRRTEEYPDADMLTRARQLFAKVLDLSGGLQIQTFHSFCQALLGRFPLEAGMAPGFEGMDEADARETMASAKDQMLAYTQTPAGAAVRKALDKVAGLVTENTFDEVIERLSFEASTLRRAEQAYGTMGLVPALYRALDLTPGETKAMVLEAAIQDDAFDLAGMRTMGPVLLAGSKTEQKAGEAITAFTAAEGAARKALFDDYALAFLTAAGTPRARIAVKKTLTDYPEFEAIIDKEQTRLMRVTDRLARIEAAEATTALLQLGLAQLGRYHAIKSERGLVDFDDMIDRTVGLLSRGDVAPWVLFKLDAQVDHILVDEAQDTNRDQWRVVEALATEFFSGEGARDRDVVRTIFAVGDAKQSIFSFQRADPREFVAARDRVFHRAWEAECEAEPVPLNLSFRSGGAVLSLVDAVFHREADAWHGLSADLEHVEHQFIRSGHGGLVELWPLEAPAADNEGDEEATWVPPTVQEQADDAEGRTAWRIAHRIHDMIRNREELEAQGRPIEAGDVLVLVRRRTAFVDHLVRALKYLGVPVAGRDRMVLTDELPVMDLLALAHAALLPTDDLTLATVLKSPFVGFDDDLLFDLAYGRKGALWHALQKKATEPSARAEFAHALKFMQDVIGGADILTPFEFFCHVLTDLGGRKKLTSRLGEEVHDPIDELLEEALRFEHTQAASLQAFIHRVEHGGTQIKRDMEAAGGAVRIMTAHSAKGLQAPIVFLSDLVSMPDVSRDGRVLPLEAKDPDMPPLLLWTSPAKNLAIVEEMKAALKESQVHEYRRLLYVALTRAEDRLYIAGWQDRREPNEHCWFKAIEAGFERIGAEDIELTDGREVKRLTVEQTADVPPVKAKAEASATAALPDWITRAMPDEPDPPRPLAPSRPDEDEPAATSPTARGDGKRFERGRLIHTLLEWLPDMPVDTRADAARAYLRRSGGLPDSDVEAFWREVENILNDPVFSPLFAPGSRAEVQVAGSVGSRVISGQVDRLVVTESDVLIVDYKTNRPPPRDAAGVAPIYLKQMGLYARALEGIYPDKQVRTALLWTDIARLMELSKSQMDEALKAMGL
ncbi:MULTISPECIES: double-strand break repair helicase AddA [Kordiimonas]|uniref:double-strand break repair helicase AddA n=1 Tax=Kordiimonas TaxID=288021 RepID=UPI00257C6754|nr:double-strand break repair helicase AddA [Kordiimonas sp. UBA4487]